jgi:hypothetical protein
MMKSKVSKMGGGNMTTTRERIVELLFENAPLLTKFKPLADEGYRFNWSEVLTLYWIGLINTC